MPFLCCGNNSAIVEDTAQGVVDDVLKKQEPFVVAEPAIPASTSTTDKPVVPKESPKKPVVEEQSKSSETIPTAPAPAPAVKVPEISKGSGTFLSSLIGPDVALNGKSLSTDATLNDSAIVVLLYANANDILDETKKLEIFLAGYEAKTLDIVYIPEKKDDVYIANGVIPTTWYCVPKCSSTIKKSLKEKFSLVPKQSCLIITNPSTDTVIDSTTKSYTKIMEIDPTDTEYDTKASKIFQEWITNLPMETTIVDEVELMYEEPVLDDDDDSAESDSDDE